MSDSRDHNIKKTESLVLKALMAYTVSLDRQLNENVQKRVLLENEYKELSEQRNKLMVLTDRLRANDSFLEELVKKLLEEEYFTTANLIRNQFAHKHSDINPNIEIDPNAVNTRNSVWWVWTEKAFITLKRELKLKDLYEFVVKNDEKFKNENRRKVVSRLSAILNHRYLAGDLYRYKDNADEFIYGLKSWGVETDTYSGNVSE